jgi:hypothetical protein
MLRLKVVEWCLLVEVEFVEVEVLVEVEFLVDVVVGSERWPEMWNPSGSMWFGDESCWIVEICLVGSIFCCNV